MMYEILTLSEFYTRGQTQINSSSYYYFHKRQAISLLSVCLNAGIGSVAPVYGTSHFRDICF